jgi:twitching motility two-component system response regulator PilH
MAGLESTDDAPGRKPAVAAFDFFRRILRNVPGPEGAPPAAGDAPAPAVAAPAANNAPLINRRRATRMDAREGLRILIIDDSATVVATLGRMLRQNHYETAGAADAETGIAFAREERPDLIFLDIVLPGMSGFDALRTLRKDEATRAIPIIMISGNAQATEQFYVRRIGADDFMKKPFGRAEVFTRIQQLVEAGRLPPRTAPLVAAPETEGAALVVEPDASVLEHELAALGIDVDGVAVAELPAEDA